MGQAYWDRQDYKSALKVYPERFFPEYVKDYDASVAMNQQLIKELGSISVSFKDSTVRMMNELDQENARFRMSLKAAFVDMNMHPCSNEAEQNFRTLSTRLTDFNFRINEINKDVAEAKVILSTPDTKSLPDTIQPVVDDAKKSLGKDSVNIKAIKIYQQNQVLRNFGNTINEMKLHNIRIKPR